MSAGAGATRATVTLWLLAGLLAGVFLVRSARDVPRSTNGFVAYYTASRVLLEAEPAAALYDDAWFEARVRRYEPGVRDIYFANPPAMALLALPVAALPYPAARAVWIGVNTGLALLLIGWLIQALALRGPLAPGLACFILAWAPVRENIRHGQFYLFGLVLLVIAWEGLRRRRPAGAGLPLALLAGTKAAGLMLWPLLAVRRRWRAMAWGVGGLAGLVAVSLPVLGGEVWARFILEARELGSNPLLGVTAYQSGGGFLRHLFGAGGEAVGEPLLHAPVLAATLPVVAGLALLLLSLRAARGRDIGPAFAAFVLLSLVLSPVSSEAHYTLAILPVAILGVEVRDRPTRAGAAALLAGAILIAAPFPYRSPALRDGALSLLAYPRLYGAVLLWGLALAAARPSPDPAWSGAGLVPSSAGGAGATEPLEPLPGQGP